MPGNWPRKKILKSNSAVRKDTRHTGNLVVIFGSDGDVGLIILKSPVVSLSVYWADVYGLLRLQQRKHPNKSIIRSRLWHPSRVESLPLGASS